MAARKPTKPRPLGTAERAVYALIERGVCTPAHVLLYPDEIDNLIAHGIVRLDGEGAPVPVHAPRAEAPHASTSAPAPEPMVSLVSRIPRELRQELADLGRPTLSDAVREALTAGLEALRARK